MNYFKYDIVFQEVPGEISLVLSITGCPLHCEGCHSPELWNPSHGSPLSLEILESLIQRYKMGISCVLFMGGEWEPEKLTDYLKWIQTIPLKTALYTGRELNELPSKMLRHLNYLKTGPWKPHLGGLNSESTNQKLFKISRSTLSCL